MVPSEAGQETSVAVAEAEALVLTLDDDCETVVEADGELPEAELDETELDDTTS